MHNHAAYMLQSLRLVCGEHLTGELGNGQSVSVSADSLA